MTRKLSELSERMKEYEAFETQRRFLPMLPIVARIDGRNFSSFTRDMVRPFDSKMTDAMIQTTKELLKSTHALVGYTQSDEISLLWYAEDYNSSVFFDGKIMKMTGVLASLATAYFTKAMCDFEFEDKYFQRTPHFDCRVVQLPTKAEAANMFLFREQDSTKNAVSMAARAYYSHKQLDHKNTSEMQEMLFEKGINFNDYPAKFKRGTFVQKKNILRPLSNEELMRIPEKHRPSPAEMVIRSQICEVDMPKFGSVTNRVEVLFDGAIPIGG